jgi:hypothetical protein
VIAVEFTVGRHAAGDGADVHPIVAAALSRSPALPGPRAPRHGQESRLLTGSDGEVGLGWPGDPADGAGLGWPPDLSTTAGGESSAQTPITLVAEPVRRRAGWRRLFGGRASSAA